VTDKTDTDKTTPTPAITTQPLVSLTGLNEALCAGVQLAGITPRLGFIEHPDRVGQPGAKIPVALVTEIDDEGAPVTSVKVLTGVIEEMDKRAPGPRRRTGSVRLTDEDSFIAFVNRWGSVDTVIYADTSALAFAAVLDDHPIGDDINGLAASRWREHRATYACPRSPEWQAWTANDEKWLTQTAFADFIEARLEDMVKADACAAPLDVLQMARQLHIRTKGTFQREVNQTTGDSILVNKTETETGSTVIPRAFAIAIPVFEGGERYQIEARVRFGFVEGVPRFSYTLHRRKEIERDAFGAVRRKIDSATGRLVLAGTP
jgi:uncharacterized protein YfdQ (DUF2303 family)